MKSIPQSQAISWLAPFALDADAGAGTSRPRGDPRFCQRLQPSVEGWDHILAMVAVGLWAAQLGGRALWPCQRHLSAS